MTNCFISVAFYSCLKGKRLQKPALIYLFFLTSLIICDVSSLIAWHALFRSFLWVLSAEQIVWITVRAHHVELIRLTKQAVSCFLRETLKRLLGRVPLRRCLTGFEAVQLRSVTARRSIVSVQLSLGDTQHMKSYNPHTLSVNEKGTSVWVSGHSSCFCIIFMSSGIIACGGSAVSSPLRTTFPCLAFLNADRTLTCCSCFLWLSDYKSQRAI